MFAELHYFWSCHLFLNFFLFLLNHKFTSQGLCVVIRTKCQFISSRLNLMENQLLAIPGYFIVNIVAAGHAFRVDISLNRIFLVRKQGNRFQVLQEISLAAINGKFSICKIVSLIRIFFFLSCKRLFIIRIINVQR